jgi:hypothetical protein
MKNILIFFLIVFAYSLKAQLLVDDSMICNAKKIDVQRLKRQSYLEDAKRINCCCDSLLGTILELRICANLELQKQDSLMHCELDSVINECKKRGDTAMIREIILTQELWERYRYALCNSCTMYKGSYAKVQFMKCASEMTIKRREEIRKIWWYR